MSNAFIINAHQPYPFAQGKLNATLAKRISSWLEQHGYQTQHTAMTDAYDVEEEVAKHQWADLVVLQAPVNWMGVPWSFKKYMDEVYSAGMNGRLCQNDGRSSAAPKQNYGTGGVLRNTRYMMSLTFNAPQESFGNKDEWFFGGMSVDDLFMPGGMAVHGDHVYVVQGAGVPADLPIPGAGTLVRFDLADATPLLSVTDEAATIDEDQRLVAGDAPADSSTEVIDDVPVFEPEIPR